MTLIDADGVMITEVKEAPAAYPLLAESAVEFDWSAVTRDLACLDLDPTTVEHVTLWYYADLVCSDVVWADVPSSSLTGLIDADVAGNVSVTSDELTFAGNAVDFPPLFLEDPTDCWLFTLEKDERTTLVAEIVPTADATTTAMLVDDCIYEASAALADATPALPEPDPTCGTTWTVGWAGLTTSSTGEALDPTEIDTVDLYAYTGSLADVDVLDLGATAEDVWSTSVTGTTLTLDDVDLDDGRAWVMALRDSDAGGYVPAWVTVLRS